MMSPGDYLASTSALLAVAESIDREWATLGARGHFLARNIDTGDELGFNTQSLVALASVAKVPIALAVLDHIARGSLAADRQVTLDPQATSRGVAGGAGFRHPATLAVADLVMLMLTISDNAAADLLLDLVGIDQVTASLDEWGHPDVHVRHSMRDLSMSAYDAAGGDPDLALDLATRSGDAGGNTIWALNPLRGSAASAHALVGLLQDIWLDRIAEPTATEELRRLMSLQVFNHRLSSDLRSDSIRVSGKTGSFLHLRHEIGVVESDTGDRVAIAALTTSTRPAVIAHDIDLGIGTAARAAFEALRN
jgi:beta-lactamase class A